MKTSIFRLSLGSIRIASVAERADPQWHHTNKVVTGSSHTSLIRAYSEMILFESSEYTCWKDCFDVVMMSSFLRQFNHAIHAECYFVLLV